LHETSTTDIDTLSLHDALPICEVGHMNLGAGRIVYQDLVKINLAIENKTLASNKVLQHTFKYAKENNKPLHLLGLLSDGGVHARSEEHTSELQSRENLVCRLLL